MSHLLEIVLTTLAAHPRDCVFDKTAEEILADTFARCGPNPTGASFVDACQDAFEEAEIYCPHRVLK